MNTSPSISVVIPCYNGARFLCETLDSVLTQTLLPVEVLVIDDGSTDDSAAIADAYGELVRVIRQENQGESVARNRGIEEARGEWVAFVDADDVWKPEKLEKQIELIDPETVGLHTSYYNFGFTTGVADMSEVPPETRYSLEFVARHSPLNTSTLMVRKATSPRFPVWTQYAEDTVFQLELVQRGDVKLVAEAMVGYRRHAGSQSKSTTDIHFRRHETIITWLSNNSKQVSPEVSQRIQTNAAVKLVAVAQHAKWQRDWQAFHEIRKYLQRYDHFPEVQKFLRRPVLPRIIYYLKDGLSPQKSRLGS